MSSNVRLVGWDDYEDHAGRAGKWKVGQGAGMDLGHLLLPRASWLMVWATWPPSLAQCCSNFQIPKRSQNFGFLLEMSWTDKNKNPFVRGQSLRGRKV